MEQLKCLNDVKYVGEGKNDKDSKDEGSNDNVSEADDGTKIADGQKVPETE